MTFIESLFIPTPKTEEPKDETLMTKKMAAYLVCNARNRAKLIFLIAAVEAIITLIIDQKIAAFVLLVALIGFALNDREIMRLRTKYGI